MELYFSRPDIAALLTDQPGAQVGVAFIPSGRINLRLLPRGPAITALAVIDYQPGLLPVQLPGWRVIQALESAGPVFSLTVTRLSERTVTTTLATMTAHRLDAQRHASAAIGKEVRAHRKTAGLSPHQLAARLNQPAPHIVDLETGRRFVWPHMLWDIARLFSVPPGHFLDQAQRTLP